MLQLPEPIKILSKEGNKAVFEISPLMPGYGATIANPLRRVLLSSLNGAAVSSIKIKGVDHEFSSMPGVLEDVIEIILNVKKIRFKMHSDEPVKLNISVKGEGAIMAKDIKLTSDVEIINEDQIIATITDKKTEFNMELEIEKGVGYVPVEQKRKDKIAIGVIAIDSMFSPIKSANFNTVNVRVGDRIDFNKIILEIETDGSIEPEEALAKAASILIEHFKPLAEIKIEKEETEKAVKKSLKGKKKTK